MAEIKKVEPEKPVAALKKPVAAVKAPEKKEEVKAEVKTEVKAEAKTEAKAPVKKAAAKTPAKKAAAKKAPAKKVPAKKVPAKKAEIKEAKQIINLQFSGKSYTMEDLIKIAGDVWKYDLHKNTEVYKSVELYVKPEENIAYYVFNGDIAGSFFI